MAATDPLLTVITSGTIGDGSNSVLVSGTISFVVTDQNGGAIPFRIGQDSGNHYSQAILDTMMRTVTNGKIDGPTLKIANPLLTSPIGILYRITINDLATGKITIYRNVMVVGADDNTWDFTAMETGLLLPQIPYNKVVGPAGTIAIGNVSKGDVPSVSNVGTPSAALLNIVLPKGDQGDPGPRGAGGANGVVGTASGNFVATAFTGVQDGVNAISTISTAVSFLLCWRNGIWQTPGVDYTITDPTHITWTVPLKAKDKTFAIGLSSYAAVSGTTPVAGVTFADRKTGTLYTVSFSDGEEVIEQVAMFPPVDSISFVDRVAPHAIRTMYFSDGTRYLD